ncbi:MAG: tubulin-like doman-containing protein [Candidatus Aenigmatarchaeota archaeon]
MSYYIIGIGGTSARCVESLIHLSAMGLGPEKLYILFVDPDEANWNLNRTIKIISQYLTCKEILGNPKEYSLFQTEIIFSLDENNQPIYAWSPVKGERNLYEYFNYYSLPQQIKHFSRFLYTQQELEELKWDQGFCGRPAVGAPVMTKILEQINQQPWYGLINNIKETLQKDFAKIMIFATIFGGTGASGFPTVAKILRELSEKENWQNKNKFKIGGVLLLPYFSYSLPPEIQNKIYANPNNFLLNTKSALSHYSFLWSDGSPYDAIYLLGDTTFDSKGREFGEGGDKQKNVCHYIEFLAALAALSFFFQEQKEGRENFQYYAQRKEEKTISWSDLPINPDVLDHQKILSRMIYFTSLASSYLSFYFPLIRSKEFQKQEKRKNITWYTDFFSDNKLLSSEEQSYQQNLADYFISYLQWVYEFHLFTEREIKLLNKNALEELKEKKYKFISNNNFKRLLDGHIYSPVDFAWDELWEELCSLDTEPEAKSSTGKFIFLLHQAIEKFCKKNYNL